jgi:hypothetical protein
VVRIYDNGGGVHLGMRLELPEKLEVTERLELPRDTQRRAIVDIYYYLLKTQRVPLVALLSPSISRVHYTGV